MRQYLLLSLLYCLSTATTLGQQSFHQSSYSTQEALAQWLYEEAIHTLVELPTTTILEASSIEHHRVLGDQVELAVQMHIRDLATNTSMSTEPLERLIDHYAPHPALAPAYLALGSHYYNEKAYNSAIDAYNHVNTSSMDGLTLSAYNFKKGYCHFVRKEFDAAEQLLAQTKALRNIYYYPTNYYWGMCQYFSGNYDEAVVAFDRVSSSSVYKSLIPYYISQIYFAQEQYDQLISYGEQVIVQASTDNVKDIRLLIGQAYYKKGMYQQSLDHLEYYEANTTTLTKEEFYQLAFTQYRLGYYDRAIDNFLELTLLDDEMGQIASNYLADCYQRLEDRSSARTAYRKVSQMDYNPDMQLEALFNYGKLSAEMGYDREAINSMVTMPSDSPYYRETRRIINDLLSTTEDFESAIQIIDGLEDITDDLRATHQRLCYQQGIRLINDSRPDEAVQFLDRVKDYPVRQSLVAQSLFWKAYLPHQAGDYEKSIALFENFYPQAKDVALELNNNSSIYAADYTQGYNYLKLGDHATAGFYFKRAVQGINRVRDRISDKTLLTQILPDALIRAGDCYFKLGNYQEAQIYYDQSIDREQAGFVYAMYQRALIEGLTGRVYDKVITLQDITDLYPKHPYADDAFMQLGDTYHGLQRFLPARDAFLIISDDIGGPYKNRALLKLGLIAFNQGDPQTALSYYQRIFGNTPTTSESQEAVLAIEEIYVDELSDPDAYFAWLATVPGLEVTAFAKDSVNYQVAINYYEQSRYEKATEAFSKYLDKYGSGYFRHNARYYNGESHAALRQYSQAQRMYDQVVQAGLNPFYLKALRKGAIIAYNHTRDYGKSLRYWRKLARENLEDQPLYEAQLGALQSAYRARDLEATQLFATTVKSNPLAQRSERVSAAYYVAKLAQASKDYALAIEQYDQVASSTTNELGAESRYRLGEIYFSQGRLTDAEQQCEVTNAESTGYPYWIAKNLVLLGEIYLRNEDSFNARAAVEAVIENFKEADIQKEAQALLAQVEILEQQQDRIKTQDSTLELDNGN